MRRKQFLRLELTSFNNLNGAKVARDLKENAALWESFVFGRFGIQDLLELGDLGQGFINADTLYVLTKRNRLVRVWWD